MGSKTGGATCGGEGCGLRQLRNDQGSAGRDSASAISSCTCRCAGSGSEPGLVVGVKGFADQEPITLTMLADNRPVGEYVESGTERDPGGHGGTPGHQNRPLEQPAFGVATADGVGGRNAPARTRASKAGPQRPAGVSVVAGRSTGSGPSASSMSVMPNRSNRSSTVSNSCDVNEPGSTGLISSQLTYPVCFPFSIRGSEQFVPTTRTRNGGTAVD